MNRNLLRSIKNSLGRYIAIAMIIALGAGIFVGLRMTKADMVATGQKYTDAQNMFDLRLVCSYGWTDKEVESVKRLDGLVDVEGMFYSDLIVNVDNATDDQVYRLYTIPQTINRLVLLGGRMPENGSECLMDGYQNGDEMLGKQIVIQENNDEDALENVKYRTLTVVGYVRSPLYMDMTRGTTSVGNGSIKDCLYVQPDTFDVDYFTEIHATIPGDFKIYSDRYNDAMESVGDAIESDMLLLAQQRFDNLKADAEEEYQDGWEEYMDGVQEYTDGMHEAYDELKEAYFDLLDAESEIADAELEIADGEEQIKKGWEDLYKGRLELDDAEKTLQENRKLVNKQISDARTDLTQKKSLVEDGLKTVNENIAVVNQQLDVPNQTIQACNQAITDANTIITDAQAQITQAENGIKAIDEQIAAGTITQEEGDNLKTPWNTQKNTATGEIAKQQGEIAKQQAIIAGIEQNPDVVEARAILADLKTKQGELNTQLGQINGGLSQLSTQEAQANVQFEMAVHQIKTGREDLAEAEKTLYNEQWRLDNAKKDLEEAKAEVADGWIEYEDGLAKAREELSDARVELTDAREELADARKDIDELAENTLHILDRNTNVGYASLDSSSDIVEGVSRVFPIFFLLVAALVCITTMTRMVDEERTQIGTLKALGYSNGAIISKYMLYAGTSAVFGCGLGVLMGSVVFPAILWEAYKIMLFIDDTVVLTFDFWLCFVVVAAYTLVELLVTWYCCRRALDEVPAELIRPKAPTVGKELIFERFRAWDKLSFLNKVTIRNIFRYRQRLAMMLVGIGGCTALLLTGFGLRDSIVNIVDFQFEDVTTYDMEVYFEDGQTPSQIASFRQEMAPYAQDIHFYHQTSVELDYDNQVREIYMIASEKEIQNFIDFHHGDQQLAYPDVDEILLSSGVADAMNIEVGDMVTLRDSDLRTMNLTVSGIYYNYVYNYTILSPQTIEKHWGETPEQQMALVRILDGQEVHQVSAKTVDFDNVMNVSVSEDLAFMVHNMMDALDLVVWVIVFCAALLAATVLYNLTNININERIREIATIKVLGFNAGETGMYIFKENLILSVMGAGLGLLLGKLLLDFVMSQVKINMVWFMSRALPLSYVLSVIMTILMALIVDFVFYFKLQKINMAEALKSVE